MNAEDERRVMDIVEAHVSARLSMLLEAMAESLRDERAASRWRFAWDHITNAPITVLECGSRAHNALMAEEIQFVGQLVGLTEEDLRSLPNIGRQTAQDIQSGLNKVGLSLRRKTN